MAHGFDQLISGRYVLKLTGYDLAWVWFGMFTRKIG